MSDLEERADKKQFVCGLETGKSTWLDLIFGSHF